MQSMQTLKQLAIQELYKHAIKSFYSFDKNKEYFLIDKEGLHIDLGTFIKYENKSIIDYICFHDGPTFSKIQWHFEFSKMDEDLKKEFELISENDFYAKYVGFYPYS
jgi:hypothetical protein